MRRFLLTVAVLLTLFPLSAVGADPEAGIDVIDVSGPLDASALEFMRSSIELAAERGQVLAVLQIDSPAVLDGAALEALNATVQDPPLPVAIWVGPAPAVAYGGIAQLVTDAEWRAISPGSYLGKPLPTIAGDDIAEGTIGEINAIPAEETGLDLQPTIRQYLQDLDGETFATADGPVVVETLKPFEDGVTLKTVTFLQPSLGTRFFRLAVIPEAAFFFLVIGLTIVSFEFFAMGPGVAAGVASICLLLAGWGIVNLPVRWWALALAVFGWGLLTAAYQKGGVIVLTILGALLLQIGGIWFVEGSGQIDARWFLILPSVLVVLFFFLLAMPTVQRARYSTQTIGRDSLIGETGVARVGLDPDGIVEVHGARWRATSHREAKVATGTQVVVTGVDGLFLEVDRVPTEREN
ncbi:MAG TPA: NfeD family protein [Acidimicrobiia bacterium]